MAGCLVQPLLSASVRLSEIALLRLVCFCFPIWFTLTRSVLPGFALLCPFSCFVFSCQVKCALRPGPTGMSFPSVAFQFSSLSISVVPCFISLFLSSSVLCLERACNNGLEDHFLFRSLAASPRVRRFQMASECWK